MRRFLPLLLIAVALLMDVSVLPVLTQHWLVPRLTLCTVSVLGLLLGRTQGALYGLVAGAVAALLTESPMGLFYLLYVMTGTLCGLAGRKFQRYLLTVPAAPFLCFAIYEGVLMLYMFLAGRSFSGRDGLHTLGRVLLETLLCQGLYLWFNHMLKPSWSRYAGR